MLFDEDYNPQVLFEDSNEKSEAIDYVSLRNKFHVMGEKPSGSLSFSQIISLINTVERIIKALITDDAERLITLIAKRLMVQTDTLTDDFISSARYFFERFKPFKQMPQYKEVMEILTRTQEL